MKPSQIYMESAAKSFLRNHVGKTKQYVKDKIKQKKENVKQDISDLKYNYSRKGVSDRVKKFRKKWSRDKKGWFSKEGAKHRLKKSAQHYKDYAMDASGASNVKAAIDATKAGSKEKTQGG